MRSEEGCLIKQRDYRKLVRPGVAALAMAVVLMFGVVPRSHAENDRAKCQHRIEKSEVKLDKAVRKHGAGSRQAQTARRELNLEREHCWTQYHAWWDAHTRQWRNEHDWDRDRDRDHDRDR